jgi:WS/DGAT/MGAT family acyltransferase
MPLDLPKRSRPRASGAAASLAQKTLARLSKLPGDLIGMGNEVINLGAQRLNLKPRNMALPFAARRTLFNNAARSAERRYANCELPLAKARAIAKASGTSVNDVLMTAIDDALHHYLKLRQQPTDKPLVVIMPMSLRGEGEAAEGNQATIDLIPMGQPRATLRDRLQQIHDATQRAKEKGRALPRAVRDFYALFVFGTSTAAAVASAFARVPSSNLIISNMKGPTEPLYLGGARLAAFHGLPIVPPGGGLNVTFASFDQTICLGVGAAPEAVDDPMLLTELIAQSLDALDMTILGAAKKKAAPARKTTKTNAKTKEKLA